MSTGGIGLRDKNGKELFPGDRVKVVFWDRYRGEHTGPVSYDAANACWLIGTHRICELGRDRGTTIEVIEGMEGAKPVKSRRKGKPS